jgi:uncharacterized RDD family membrane protein YckC
MTDPAGGTPTPPPGTPPPATTPPASAPPASAPPSNWQQPATQTGGFQTAPVAAGPAPGVVYADLVTRIIAYIIDAIVLTVITWVVGIILVGLLTAIGGVLGLLVGFIVFAVVVLVGSAVYFVYTWMNMRASPGQRVLGLETVNAADGSTLTQPQAVRRWGWLYGIFALATVAQIVLTGSSLSLLSTLLSLATLGYTIYLLYSASQSPKRQGYHDVQAGTVVVKRVSG